MAAHRGQREQVVEARHPEARRPLEQHVQQVSGGQGVVERAVGRCVAQTEVRGEGAELEVGHLVAYQAAGQPVGVDRAVVEAGSVGAEQGGLEEADVEAHVVTDHHRAPDELEQRG